MDVFVDIIAVAVGDVLRFFAILSLAQAFTPGLASIGAETAEARESKPLKRLF
jgi:hypothetical protein